MSIVEIERIQNRQTPLSQLIKEFYETVTEAEMTEHLGYAKNKTANKTNYRNGYIIKNIRTTFGKVRVKTPRDRNGSFNPVILKKRDLNLQEKQDIIIALHALNIRPKEVKRYFRELYGENYPENSLKNIIKAFKKKRAQKLEKLNSYYESISIYSSTFTLYLSGEKVLFPAYIMVGNGYEGMEILSIYQGKNRRGSFWKSALQNLKERGVQTVSSFKVEKFGGFEKAAAEVFPNSLIEIN